jgi:hypothetical protein
MIHTNKLILLSAVLVAVVLVAGCTSATPGGNPTSAASSKDVTDGINAAFTSAGYKVITPFIKTTVNGLTAYTGVVDDGNNVLQPYRNNITIVVASDRATALKEYNASIAKAQANVYTPYAYSTTSWEGIHGSTSYPNQVVWVGVNQPSSSAIVTGLASYVFLKIDDTAYTVSIDYQSPM